MSKYHPKLSNFFLLAGDQHMLTACLMMKEAIFCFFTCLTFKRIYPPNIVGLLDFTFPFWLFCFYLMLGTLCFDQEDEEKHSTTRL